MNQFPKLLDMLHVRESVRAYKADPVDKSKVLQCIEAARLAPSACNAQPWKFIVVDQPELKNALAEATQTRMIPMNHFTKQAPVHVVVVREKANLSSNVGQVLKNKEYPLTDIGIAVGYFCLQAVELGLGTCILGWFDEKKVKNLLGIPAGKRAELIITIGFPANDNVRDKRRKTIDEISSFNKY